MTTTEHAITTPTVEVVQVTPDLASAWLTLNTHNRNLRRAVVDAYARDMAAGNWVFNGETIKFALDGTLLDGQHRLAAIAEAEATLPLTVVRGLPNVAQETVDVLAKRTFADVLALRGEKQVNTLASITRAVTMYLRGSAANIAGGGTTTVAELSATLEKHPDIRDSVSVAYSLRSNLRAPASIMGAMHWVLTQIDAEDAEFFFRRLAEDTGHVEGDPIYALRRSILKATAHPRDRMPKVVLAALTIKAWNLYRDGETVKLLSWKRGGAAREAFPEPI